MGIGDISFATCLKILRGAKERELRLQCGSNAQQ